MKKQSLGKKGEELAKRFLEDRGFRVLDINFHSRFGEIDLVALDKVTLVFIEVKTRISDQFGLPEEAVTCAKVKTIGRVGEYYRSLRKNLPEASRIDVVAINFEKDGKLEKISLIRNVTG